MPDNMPESQIHSQINENLKLIYNGIAKEGIPERFRILLDQLQQKAGAEGERPISGDSAAKAPDADGQG